MSVLTAIDVAELQKQEVSAETVESWCVEEQAMEVDISLLQQVENLERRVISAGLQVKVELNHSSMHGGGSVCSHYCHQILCCNNHIWCCLPQGWMHPEPQSQREDLVYHEHKLFSSSAPEKTRQRETSQEELPGSMVRRPNNPLDMAVVRLAELEKNIERRYLKRPLSAAVQIRLNHVNVPSSSGEGKVHPTLILEIINLTVCCFFSVSSVWWCNRLYMWLLYSSTTVSLFFFFFTSKQRGWSGSRDEVVA